MRYLKSGWIFSFIAAVVLFCGISSGRAGEYLLQPGDQLQIYVYGHGDLSSRRDLQDSVFVIRPDGKLDFPLAGEINAAGLTVQGFEDVLEKCLSEYIIEPKITVNLVEYGKHKSSASDGKR